MGEHAGAREEILARVRHSLGVGARDIERIEAVEGRLRHHERNLVPQRAQGSTAQNVQGFWKMMEAADGTVGEVETLAEIPGAVTDYLRQHNLPQRIRRGTDPALEDLPWDQSPGLRVEIGAASKADQVSLSHAFGAVAETGTLVMTSGADNPTTLNFMPENHIVIIEAGRIAGSYEDVWDAIRAVHGEGKMPRTVNLISGPSRTGDIEQKIELGAHGPRRLHVIILHQGHPAHQR